MTYWALGSQGMVGVEYLTGLGKLPAKAYFIFAPVKVQGLDMKQDLLRGLQWFAHHAGRFDVLCILRGGGSRTDLAWFDDRDLAFAVARHPLKIVVGIGQARVG